MKNLAAFFVFTILISFNYPAQAASDLSPNLTTEVNAQPRWEKLGVRKVNFRLDRDEIYVTAREGRFSKLRLQVNKGGINLHRVVVHYGNGETQTIRVNRSIPPGAQSGVLGLDGGRRIISKVVFYYDTKNFSQKKANVVLWGRH